MLRFDLEHPGGVGQVNTNNKTSFGIVGGFSGAKVGNLVKLYRSLPECQPGTTTVPKQYSWLRPVF
jgi:hypothetical protein